MRLQFVADISGIIVSILIREKNCGRADRRSGDLLARPRPRSIAAITSWSKMELVLSSSSQRISSTRHRGQPQRSPPPAHRPFRGAFSAGLRRCHIENRVEPVILAEDVAAGLGGLDEMVQIEIGENRKLADDIADHAQLGVGDDPVDGRHGHHHIDQSFLYRRFGATEPMSFARLLSVCGGFRQFRPA